MFGCSDCSDVYHWMGRSAKAVCLPGLRTYFAFKAHNLDATTFWSAPFSKIPQRHRNSARHRRSPKSAAAVGGYAVVEHHLLHPLQELARLPEDIAQIQSKGCTPLRSGSVNCRKMSPCLLPGKFKHHLSKMG